MNLFHLLVQVVCLKKSTVYIYILKSCHLKQLFKIKKKNYILINCNKNQKLELKNNNKKQTKQ